MGRPLAQEEYHSVIPGKILSQGEGAAGPRDF